MVGGLGAMMRQIGGMVVGLFVFFAIVAAMSRLLNMKELPDYITNATDGVANLFKGVLSK